MLCLLVVAVSAQTDNDDTQFWHETKVEFPLDRDKNLSGIIIGNLRISDNITDPADRRIGFAVKYKATKNLTIQPSYIFRNQGRPGSDRFEHRFRLDITPKKSFNSFSIENRSRFEHRAKTAGRNDDTFYRNRTKLKVPVRKNDETLFTPFVSNDTYFDIQNPRVHRNDTVGGISKAFTKSFTTDFFYQYRRNFQSGTKHINVIGVNFNFKVN
ncbi:MAG: DUF2490 domain-containing protein [Pyrinomonadaceae bacterium]|nr:DUF2490 domain-containing protein [Pyrinomonadaceae bacterium]